MTLHDELTRLADSATRPAIDHTVWDRGRALRRRDRLVTSALVLVMVLILGGLASLVIAPPRTVSPADDVGPAGAIPSTIEDVPADVTGPLESDLAIGPGSVAFITGDGRSVVITATDGRYHLLDLPDRLPARTMRVSPDGTKLAYVFAKSPGQQPETMLSGVGVVDLTTGDVGQVPAVNGGGTTVDIGSIGWSANSRWLAWSGHDVVSWGERGPVVDTTGSMGAINAESLAQSTTTATPGPVGISDDGTVTLVGRAAQIRFTAETTQRVRKPFPAGTDALSGDDLSQQATTTPDGALTAVGFTGSSEAAPFVTEDGLILQRTLAPELYPRGARVTPLGWTAPSLLLALVEPAPGGGAYAGETTSLTLFTSPDRPDSEWTYRFVVRDLPDVAELSMAVDLVPDLDGTSSQQLTHDFGEPDWPWRPDVSLLIGLGVAAAWAALLALRWVWRRRTRLG